MSNPYKKNGVVTCPYCGSTNVTYEIQGINYKKGIMSAAAIGPQGFVNAYVGATILYTCQECGKNF